MPTYVYACDSCSAQFDQFQSFKDEPVRTCPACSSAVRRVFQPVGIVFKGSGWYITDSRKNNGTNGAASEASAKNKSDDAVNKSDSKTEGPADKADKAESKSEPKSETKSEPKSEPKSETKASAPTASN